MQIGLVDDTGRVALVNGSAFRQKGQTDEQGSFGQIIFALLTRPDDRVTCLVTSSNENEGKVTYNEVSISPQEWDECVFCNTCWTL